MFILKRLVVVLVSLGILVPAFAYAETSSTTPTALVGQIQALQTQINTLQQQQKQSIASLVSTLQQGTQSDQVAVLQALLAADPSIYPEGTISGFFGRLTAQAVKRFQKKHGLEQVGNVGPRTLKKLQDFLKGHPLAFDTASTTATSTSWGRDGHERKGEDKRPCAIVPPGQLIAPGWLKKHKGDDEDRLVVPECQNLPPGIRNLFGDDDRDDDHRGSRGTTTPPTATPTPLPTDTTAPVISAVSVSNISSTTAMISWQTNEAATGKIYYSTTTPVGLSSALTISNSSLVTAHSLGFTGLTASTTYYYILESKDAAMNTTTTTPSTQNFTTTN